jgi:hypothetical protein
MRLSIIILLLPTICLSNTIIQIKDYLCGCKHCNSVPTGQPLDIASHMMLCESQREGMLKTIEIMNRTKKPKTPNTKDIQSNTTMENQKADKSTSNNYSWNKDPEGEWQYSEANNQSNISDSWIYKPHIGWLWTFNKGQFLYSEHHGWLYNYRQNNKRIFYWYDKRKWILSRDMPKQK